MRNSSSRRPAQPGGAEVGWAGESEDGVVLGRAWRPAHPGGAVAQGHGELEAERHTSRAGGPRPQAAAWRKGVRCGRRVVRWLRECSLGARAIEALDDHLRANEVGAQLAVE